MGTYVLALWLAEPEAIAVGRLGEFSFVAGWYLYVGSALGPGGLRARLARHFRRRRSGKRIHWHVDYLRERAVWAGAWTQASVDKLECHWAAAILRLPGARLVAPGFGASDCGCPSHLVHLPALPSEVWFTGTLGAERFVVANDELNELLKALATTDDDGREAAALALARYGTTAIKRLAEMLAVGDADARWWAARALAEIGGAGAIPPLVGVLQDPDPDVRACAALALGRIGDGEAAPELAARLADESAFVASITADALSMLGESAVEPLAQRLNDDSPHVRLLAVRALSRIGSQQAIGPLFGVLEDPSYLVRHYAQEALEALGVGIIFISP